MESPASYFILGLVFGERSQANAALLIAQVVARVRGLLVFFSDGWRGYGGCFC